MDSIIEYFNVPAVLSLRSLQDEKVQLATDNFLLMNFNETDQERIATFYTLSLPSVYVGAGRQPKVYSYGGAVVDSGPGEAGIAKLLHIYDRYLRGTSCISNKMIAELMFRDQFRKGYVVNVSLEYNANRPSIAQLAFGMFVVSEYSTRLKMADEFVRAQ